MCKDRDERDSDSGCLYGDDCLKTLGALPFGFKRMLPWIAFTLAIDKLFQFMVSAILAALVLAIILSLVSYGVFRLPRVAL